MLNEESLKNNNVKVTFYTGLPFFETLMAVFTYVSVRVVSGPRSTLTKSYVTS